jgi:hypothetical protein
VLPFWHSEIAPDIRAGKRVIIAAHGTSLTDNFRTQFLWRRWFFLSPRIASFQL